MWIGDLVAERFVIERPIGSGGMGIVFRARDRETNEAVAIKVLDAADAGVRERFDREARVLEQLSHPAVVRHVAHGDATNGPFLVMELLEGTDLSSYLLGVRPTLADTVAIVTRAAAGLSAAHGVGIVHRDVKPANLFLVGSDPRAVKVLDFGVARTQGRAPLLTQSGTLLGTVGYMAPEQVTHARHVDARADVFALGCVLFECLTGTPAFTGPNAVVAVTKTMFEDPPRPSELVPGLTDAYDELVARMLAKDPEERPRDAGAVLDELRAITGEPSVGRMTRRSSPPPPAERIASVIVGLAEGSLFEASETMRPEDVERKDTELRSLAARFQADLRRLSGGGFLLELEGESQENVARRASECALELCAIEPALGIAIATGSRLGPGGIGSIIERADEVLRNGAGLTREGPIADSNTAEHCAGATPILERDGVFVLTSTASRLDCGPGAAPREATLNVVAEDRVRVRSPALQAFLSRPREKRKLGPFFLERPLGKGGFAPVWLATEVYDGIELRKAAVKLFAFDGSIARENETRYREHVVREARALCQVEHPNIVRFYSLLIEDEAGIVGLAMEYLMGPSLADRLRAAGALPPEEAVRVGTTVAAALDAAHAVGIVHRDVKPANVMESPAGYKLIDFGIATDDEPDTSTTSRVSRALPDEIPIDHGATRLTMVLDPGRGDPAKTAAVGVLASGTVGYIDPVCVATGATATPASDLYSLGVMLFECLTGTLPAMAVASRRGLSGAVLDGRERAPSIREVGTSVPIPLADLVDRLLAPDRLERPRTASETLRALEDTLRPTSTVTRTIGPELVTVPASKRPRLAIAGLGALGIAAAAAFAFRAPAPRVVAEEPPIARAPDPKPPSPVVQEPTPANLEGHITVFPATATVMVDGIAARRDASGAVPLRGEAGTTFELVVRAGTSVRTERVVLLRNGRTQPDVIDATPEPPATRHAVHGTGRKGTVATETPSAAPAPAAPVLKPADDL